MVQVVLDQQRTKQPDFNGNLTADLVVCGGVGGWRYIKNHLTFPGSDPGRVRGHSDE